MEESQRCADILIVSKRGIHDRLINLHSFHPGLSRGDDDARGMPSAIILLSKLGRDKASTNCSKLS